MGQVLKLSKSKKSSVIRKELDKIASRKKSKTTLRSFYGALPDTYGDGLTYQKNLRDEWK